MEGLAVIAIFIILIVRTIKKHKASIKASQEKYRPEDFGVPTEPKNAPQDAPVRQPRQQSIFDTPTHRHVEHVPTQAQGFGGEGDRQRYNTREVSCETVGHTEVAEPSIKLPELNRENLASAFIMSEILGKPKALRR